MDEDAIRLDCRASTLAMTCPTKPRSERQRVYLVHGWGASAWVWDSFLQALAQQKDRFDFELECTALNLPGYGANQNIVGYDDISQMAEVLLAKLESDQHNIVIGWSLGGLVARKMAALNPQLVQKLITICSPPYFMQELNSDWQGLKADDLAYFKTSLDRRRFCALQVQGGVKPEDYRDWAKRFNSELVRSEVLQAGLELIEGTDYRMLEKALTMPHLSLYGAHDAIAACNRSYYNQCPMITVDVIEGSAHLPFLSHSTDVVKAIVGFINEAVKEYD